VLLESDDTCSRHSIKDPVVNEDVFYYPRLCQWYRQPRSRRNQIPLRKDVPEFACALCPSAELNSFDDIPLLEYHLRAKCVSLKSAIKF
jgi:hypothetical protein